jgi:hypothetical protein
MDKKGSGIPWAFLFCGITLVSTFAQNRIASMKIQGVLSVVLLIIFSSGSPKYQNENVEFVCYKTHKASNTCHYNFIINGAKYRHVDIGCKFANKKDEMIKKVKEGTAALAKDWKIDCPEAKEKKDSEF